MSATLPAPHYELLSPSGRLRLVVTIDTVGMASYELQQGEAVVVAPSQLALHDEDGLNRLELSLDHQVERRSLDETWEQPWGEQRYVRNHYNELALVSPEVTLRFRVFEDGMGARYELHGSGVLAIASEQTEFNVAKDSSVWWIPALQQNRYEYLYTRTPVSQMGLAHTPLTIELPTGGYVAIHEAALYDYGSMVIEQSDRGLVSRITPRGDGLAARVTLPFTLPWRTVVVADTAAHLTTSRLMLNLNEPSKIADTSWIKPMKFMGIWWGMFLGRYTWESGDKHGATTANALRYINACRELGMKGLLIEGWNEGWDGDWTQNGDKMRNMQPYHDFDIRTVTDYAKSQGIDIVGHHETSGNIAHYEYELPEAYDYYNQFGVRYIKTGYVGARMTHDEFHHSQIGVNHYQKTVELAAERGIMLDIHEPIKGTGIERTWPNLMTREGAIGQEYEGAVVVPEHTTILPYTRMLAGGMDYTPGLFSLTQERKVRTTLAKQLAFYVTMYSSLQMAADLPEHYAGQPAFAFIRDVPVSWDKTVPIDGVIGDYYVVARKDRSSEDWYVGAVSDEQERTLVVDLSFLDDHRSYLATIYRDGTNAHWQQNPESIEIVKQVVGANTQLTIRMAAGGGFAVRIAQEGQHRLPYPSHR